MLNNYLKRSRWSSYSDLFRWRCSKSAFSCDDRPLILESGSSIRKSASTSLTLLSITTLSLWNRLITSSPLKVWLTSSMFDMFSNQWLFPIKVSLWLQWRTPMPDYCRSDFALQVVRALCLSNQLPNNYTLYFTANAIAQPPIHAPHHQHTIRNRIKLFDFHLLLF